MMTPEDYELLCLAALAIGCEDVEVVDDHEWVNLHFPDGSIQHGWNPKRHSDDAIDLSARLLIGIHHSKTHVHTRDEHGRDLVAEDVGNDRAAATRLAIFRAAAEMGKTK